MKDGTKIFGLCKPNSKDQGGPGVEHAIIRDLIGDV